MLQQSKYNEAGKLLFGWAVEIKAELSEYPYVYIDTKRTVDSLVLEMLLDDRTETFTIVRSMF